MTAPFAVALSFLIALVWIAATAGYRVPVLTFCWERLRGLLHWVANTPARPRERIKLAHQAQAEAEQWLTAEDRAWLTAYHWEPAAKPIRIVHLSDGRLAGIGTGLVSVNEYREKEESS